MSDPKTFPNRTEGSVKKHWYKVRRVDFPLTVAAKVTLPQDMHYADFAEDEVCRTEWVLPGRNDTDELPQSAALLAAIKEYEASKWKVIGQKVGKPAKVGTYDRPPWACSKLTHLGVRTVCKGAFWRRRIGQDIGSSVALNLPGGGYWIFSREIA